MTNATLTLLENTIIKDCYEERMIIYLFFTTNILINKLMRYEIHQSIKNFFNHLFIEAYVKFSFVKKSMRRSRRD